MSLRQRNLAIMRQRASGDTYTDIARRFGISSVRVSQICNRGMAGNKVQSKNRRHWLTAEYRPIPFPRKRKAGA